MPPQVRGVDVSENGNNQVPQRTDWTELTLHAALNQHIWTDCVVLATDFHQDAVSHHTVSIYYIS